jgi:hypothetical protein
MTEQDKEDMDAINESLETIAKDLRWINIVLGILLATFLLAAIAQFFS